MVSTSCRHCISYFSMNMGLICSIKISTENVFFSGTNQDKKLTWPIVSGLDWPSMPKTLQTLINFCIQSFFLQNYRLDLFQKGCNWNFSALLEPWIEKIIDSILCVGIFKVQNDKSFLNMDSSQCSTSHSSITIDQISSLRISLQGFLLELKYSKKNQWFCSVNWTLMDEMCHKLLIVLTCLDFQTHVSSSFSAPFFYRGVNR